jgi:hypothetical protein
MVLEVGSADCQVEWFMPIPFMEEVSECIAGEVDRDGIEDALLSTISEAT